MIETRFKDTEVGRIPEDWEVKNISSIIDECGYGIGAEAIKYDGVNKYLRITDIDDNTHLFSPKPLSSPSPSFFYGAYIAKEGDIFIARTGASVGKSYIYKRTDGKLIFAGFLIKVHVSNANPQIVFYNTLTKRYQKWILSESARTGQPGINAEQLKTFFIPLPPTLKEQTRIATALSNIDALISELGRLIEKKRTIKQGVMQQLLTGKIRLKGFSEPWVEKKLGEIADIYQPQTISQAEFTDYGYNVYGANGVIGKYNKYNHDTDQVLVTCRGNTCGVVNLSKGKCWITGNAMVVNIDGNPFMDKIFLCFLLSYLDLTSLITGSGQPQIVRTSMSKFEICIPTCFKEQSAIASILTSMDNEISALEAKKSKYEQIKQGMMQQLLTGKIRLVNIVAKTNTISANVHFRRSVLAAEIAERLYEEPTFGHVKMEKMLFLTERLCHIDIGSHYHRDAAGPYDNRALRSIDSQLKRQEWFEVRRTEKGNRYVPMQNRGKHKKYFDKYFSAILPTFDKIIKTFKTQNTERCEIVATLYSAWEDLLHSNKPFTDADIVNEVLNNWHESKKRISQDRWLNAIQWMRENGFAPNV